MSAASTKAANYDFKAENSDGVTIYYKVNGDNATVVAGDEKYTGSVNIPETVTNEGKEYAVAEIGHAAFKECKLLASVTIPPTITAIGASAFSGCISLSSIVFPNSVKKIDDSVCDGCTNLTSVSLPNSIEEIPKFAFSDTKLKAIDIPNSVLTIGHSAFYGCMLETLEIPESVIEIGPWAFVKNHELSKVTIPSSVISIGYQVFMNSTKIREVISNLGAPFAIGTDVFPNETKSEGVLYVPEGTKGLYETTRGWNFANIIEMEPEKQSQVITLTANLQTFCSAKSLDFTGVEGLKAYIASGFSPSTGEVIMSSVNSVPAKTGLLLVGTAGQEYEVPFTETDFIYSNLFRGLIEDVEVTSGYVLSGNEFVAVDDVVTVKGGEAYLNVTPAANAPRLAIRFTDTTDLSDIAGVSAVLYDEVEASDAWYTLQGVLLKEKPSKTGIYLHGGRKVIVK